MLSSISRWSNFPFMAILSLNHSRKSCCHIHQLLWLVSRSDIHWIISRCGLSCINPMVLMRFLIWERTLRRLSFTTCSSSMRLFNRSCIREHILAYWVSRFRRHLSTDSISCYIFTLLPRLWSSSCLICFFLRRISHHKLLLLRVEYPSLLNSRFLKLILLIHH